MATTEQCCQDWGLENPNLEFYSRRQDERRDALGDAVYADFCRFHEYAGGGNEAFYILLDGLDRRAIAAVEPVSLDEDGPIGFEAKYFMYHRDRGKLLPVYKTTIIPMGEDEAIFDRGVTCFDLGVLARQFSIEGPSEPKLIDEATFVEKGGVPKAKAEPNEPRNPGPLRRMLSRN